MDKIKNKLKTKPIVQSNQFFVQLGEDSIVNPEESVTQTEGQPTLIVDNTDKPFDDTKFLETISKKRRTQVTKSSLLQQSISDLPTEEIIEITPVKPKTTKKKKKLDMPSIIIEEDVEDKSDVIELVTAKPNVEVEEEIEIIAPPVVKRKYTQREKGVVELGTEPLVQIGDIPIDERILPKTDPIDIKVSSYFQNNREIFVNFINDLFKPYKENLLTDKKDISCEDLGKGDEDFSLLTHQKIVRDYLNLYTPYRGLLLYHGLGSGKTCSSIAIAEGFQSSKQVIVMTPAYLKMNYIQEIKKCGNLMFRKNQFWEWVDLKLNPNSLNTLSAVLSLPREFIRKNKGAWLVNFSKPSNFEELTNNEKNRIDEQLDEMIQNKYKFISYNGLTKKKFKAMTNNYKTNIFDNSIIIIDEAHNLISRIVNKINKLSAKNVDSSTFPDVLALKIYELLLRANNSRVVMLSGTPLVNYPNEIGIMFNILRGYIKTWKFTLNAEGNKLIDNETLKSIFFKERTHDFMDYSATNKTLTITRNPFGFENKFTANSGYKGVFKIDSNSISDEEFVEKVVKLLKKNKIDAIERASEFKVYTALPDRLEEFASQFINEENGTIKNIEKFKRRIIGLSSYFRSAQEELLPAYDKIKNFHVVKIPMSDYQFRVYESARVDERKSEKAPTKTKKVDTNGLFIDPSSTYRIFSRMFCNFVMPQPPGRPTPKLMQMAQLLAGLDDLSKNVKKKDLVARLEAKREERKRTMGGSGEEENEDKKMKNLEDMVVVNLNYQGGAGNDPEQIENAIVGLGIMFPNLKMEQILNYLSKNKDKQSMDEIALDLQALNDPKTIQDEELLAQYENETEDVLNNAGKSDRTYAEALKTAIEFLKLNKEKYLSPEGLDTYSRKYLAMLENIMEKDHQGLHLVYSQFRTMEGVGIFSLVLEQNGFYDFKLKKEGDSWDLAFPIEKLGSPSFALYTGTEEEEEREIIRNIYNGDWKDLPQKIKEKLLKVSKNNNLGEIIKVLMITAAGSEGINLRNTRYVHIMEPYWHPVRTEQVIGRARRICSHKNLPQELQNVEVFLYLMTFTPEQLKSEIANELRAKDLSKRAPYVPLTSDEKLFEISNIKEELTGELLKGIKEASVDCSLHIKSSSKEKLTCLSFGNPSVSSFSYQPSYLQEDNDNVTNLNKQKLEWRGKEFTFNGKKMIIREGTKDVYDYDSYISALQNVGLRPILIAKLEKTKEGKYKLIEI